MLDFLLFRRMLAPYIIQFFFWISIVLCIEAGVYNLANHAFKHGLEVLLIGPILARVFCEFLIVFFRINERLTDLKNTVQQKL